MEKLELIDDDNKIRDVDPQGMLEAVTRTPDMLLDALKISQDVDLKGINSIKGVVISGMGGSAICGDIISDIYRTSSSIPITVNRDYTLPKYIDGGYLLFAISYSGNTEETLHSLKDAESRGLKIVAITSGGKLSEIAEEKVYPIIKLPSGIQPRAALPYLLTSVLIVLEKLDVINDATKNIKEASSTLNKLRTEYSKKSVQNPVKLLAKKLVEKVPLIMATEGNTAAVGRRWMTQLNENSKVLAHLAVFPELGHNEIVGMDSIDRGKNNFSAILLRDESDNERVKKRMEITKSFVGGSLGGVTEVPSSGKNGLARLLSLVFFGDLLSVYLAVLRGVDPTQVSVIERLKKELSR